MPTADTSQTERIRRLRGQIQAVRRTACQTCPEEGPQGPTDQSTRLSRWFGQMPYYRQLPSGKSVLQQCCTSNICMTDVMWALSPVLLSLDVSGEMYYYSADYATVTSTVAYLPQFGPSPPNTETTVTHIDNVWTIRFVSTTPISVGNFTQDARFVFACTPPVVKSADITYTVPSIPLVIGKSIYWLNGRGQWVPSISTDTTYDTTGIPFTAPNATTARSYGACTTLVSVNGFAVAGGGNLYPSSTPIGCNTLYYSESVGEFWTPGKTPVTILDPTGIPFNSAKVCKALAYGAGWMAGGSVSLPSNTRTNTIYHSVDGKSWTPGVSLSDMNNLPFGGISCYTLAYGDGVWIAGGGYTASEVDFGNTLYYSTDGIYWTAGTTDLSGIPFQGRACNALAYNADNKVWIAGGSRGLYSSDGSGQIWYNVNVAFRCSAIAYNAGCWVVGGEGVTTSNSDSRLYYSDGSGQNWTAGTTPVTTLDPDGVPFNRGICNAIAYNAGVWVAGGGVIRGSCNTLYYSDNSGHTWSPGITTVTLNDPDGVPFNGINGGACQTVSFDATTGQWIAGGYSTNLKMTKNNTLYSSIDGHIWTPIPSTDGPLFGETGGACYDVANTIVGGYGGAIPTIANTLYSLVGDLWIPGVSTDTARDITGVPFTGIVQFIGVGICSTVASKHGVSVAGGLSLVVGNTIYYSDNSGQTWTPGRTPITTLDPQGLPFNGSQCSSVTAGNNTWVAGGGRLGDLVSNTLYYSNDSGQTWVPGRSTDPVNDTSGIPFTGGNCVSVFYNKNSNVYVAGGRSSGNSLYYSDGSGQEWTPGVSTDVNDISGIPFNSNTGGGCRIVSCNPDSNVWIAGGNHAGNSIYYSNDSGQTWTPATFTIATPTSNTVIQALATGTNMWVAGAIRSDQPLFYSDGTGNEWTPGVSTDPMDASGIPFMDWSVSYLSGGCSTLASDASANRFVAGGYAISGNTLYYSDDSGHTWSPGRSTDVNDLSGIPFNGKNGGSCQTVSFNATKRLWIAGGVTSSDTPYTIYSSTDGISWTPMKSNDVNNNIPFSGGPLGPACYITNSDLAGGGILEG